jgi:protein TonB
MAAMNAPEAKPEDEETLTVVNFSVPPTPPRPESKPRPEPERRRIRREAPALAPLPNLSGSLSSVQIEMPDYDPESLGTVSEDLLGDLQDVVMTEDMVDQPPVVTRMPITYPERAKQREIEGRVVVSLQVNKEGRVTNTKILEATPPGVFEQAVRQAVQNWSFQPARYQGRPVQVWVNVPIPFRLN